MSYDSEDSHLSSELIEAAAGAWLSLRDRGMTAEETAGFVHWLQQDPRHAVIFEELDSTWLEFDRLAAIPDNPAASPDADLLVPRGLPRRHNRFIWLAMGAAAAIAVLLSITQLRPVPQTVATVVGALQRLDLPDGSVAQLNTNTEIETTFTATERNVRVIRGEVFFSVTKDPSRPFIVTVGHVAVRAVGTAFNVRQNQDSVEILVTEGHVRVDDVKLGQSVLPALPASAVSSIPLLGAGERVMVPFVNAEASPAQIDKVSARAVERALAWQERRLEFESVPLDEILHEFNRYNLRQLVLIDDELAAKRFSGTFRADGYESLVRLLEADFNVVATNRGSTIVLETRR